MIYQISVESASLRIQRAGNNPENNQGSVRKWANHDRNRKRLSENCKREMGKEKKGLSLSSYIYSSWKTIQNHISMRNCNKRLFFRILPICLLGLLVIPNIVDCDTIEYPTEPYIYNREEPEQTWKKKTSQFIEMYESMKMTSRRISSVTSARKNTTHKSLNSRSRKNGSVKVASRMR